MIILVFKAICLDGLIMRLRDWVLKLRDLSKTFKKYE